MRRRRENPFIIKVPKKGPRQLLPEDLAANMLIHTTMTYEEIAKATGYEFPENIRNIAQRNCLREFSPNLYPWGASVKAITVQQPYAELIKRGIKRVENRGQPIWKYGTGLVPSPAHPVILLIHAGIGRDLWTDDLGIRQEECARSGGVPGEDRRMRIEGREEKRDSCLGGGQWTRSIRLAAHSRTRHRFVLLDHRRRRSTPAPRPDAWQPGHLGGAGGEDQPRRPPLPRTQDPVLPLPEAPGNTGEGRDRGTVVRKRKRDAADWVVCHGGGAKCLRCGKKWTPKLPMDVPVFVKQANAFVTMHEDCQPKGEVKP